MSLHYPIKMNDIDNLSGREFELTYVALLRIVGYSTAHATQATNDHGIDVLYMNNQNRLVAVQVKHYGPQTRVGYKAIEEANTGADYYNADISVALTDGYFCKNALKSARTGKLNVVCLDRSFLRMLVSICNNILFNKLKRDKAKNGFTYNLWAKSKTRYFKISGLSYSEMILLNIIIRNFKEYGHKTISFKFKEFSKLLSNTKLDNSLPYESIKDSVKLHLMFNNIQHKFLVHKGGSFGLYSSINIDNDKKVISLKISDAFYAFVFEYLPFH